jgi:hypothetical protein
MKYMKIKENIITHSKNNCLEKKEVVFKDSDDIFEIDSYKEYDLWWSSYELKIIQNRFYWEEYQRMLLEKQNVQIKHNEQNIILVNR